MHPPPNRENILGNRRTRNTEVVVSQDILRKSNSADILEDGDSPTSLQGGL